MLPEVPIPAQARKRAGPGLGGFRELQAFGSEGKAE